MERRKVEAPTRECTKCDTARTATATATLSICQNYAIKLWHSQPAPPRHTHHTVPLQRNRSRHSAKRCLLSVGPLRPAAMPCRPLSPVPPSAWPGPSAWPSNHCGACVFTWLQWPKHWALSTPNKCCPPQRGKDERARTRCRPSWAAACFSAQAPTSEGACVHHDCRCGTNTQG